MDKRGLSPPGFFRAAQALPGPAAVPVHQHGDQSGGNAAAAQAGGVSPPLPQAEAGRHHWPRPAPPHAPGGDQ